MNVLLVGTGEYTTGIVGSGQEQSKSDKRLGVVALCFFELRRLGSVGKRIVLCGTNGSKFPAIRTHFARNISARYNGLDVSFDQFPPNDEQRNAEAFRDAIASMQPGDLCVIFTPDDTHYEIAQTALQRGLHVLVTKPLVQRLQQHVALVELAKAKGVVLATEVHKRWDPMYRDARHRIANELRPLSYFHSLMTQPSFQLDTFRSWAGSSSDISYYLNSHHVDFLNWCLAGHARPRFVTALGATGFAAGKGFAPDTCDTVSLSVHYEHSAALGGVWGAAVFVASWIAPPTDVHTQQGFTFLGHGGQCVVDQAHRGYNVANASSTLQSVNPLYMSYAPDPDGNFAGHSGYGYRTFDRFVHVAKQCNAGASVESLRPVIAMAVDTLQTTAVLEAGFRSLKKGGAKIEILYDNDKDWNTPVRLGGEETE